MTATAVVRACIDGQIKEKALPFEPLTPNETTVAVMREARAGKLKRFGSVGVLLADLRKTD